jgi:hypothetical protein
VPSERPLPSEETVPSERPLPSEETLPSERPLAAGGPAARPRRLPMVS